MNENINLIEILKDCPKGTKLYSPLVGEVKLKDVHLNRGNATHPIEVIHNDEGNCLLFTKEGLYYNFPNSECLLFPSKDQRDWSKFKPKKPKFDPKTLQPFNKILVRETNNHTWSCDLLSHIKDNKVTPFLTVSLIKLFSSTMKPSILSAQKTKHLSITDIGRIEYAENTDD